MPPRKPKPEKSEPARFTAGTGPLAESMAAARQAGKATRAQDMSLQQLDADGAPTGEAYSFGPGVADLEFRPDASGVERAFDEAFTAAPEPEGAENPQVAPVPAGNISMEFGTSDPNTVELVRQLTRIPIPTAVIAQWFPAYFRPDGAEQPWPTCKVFLTPQGLYVYRATPTVPETHSAGATPTWYAGVDFAETAKPVTGYAAMNAGIPIITSAGQVNVQPYGGCGCNARKLKNWTPSWARNRISWDDAVKLTDTTAGR